MISGAVMGCLYATTDKVSSAAIESFNGACSFLTNFRMDS